jgi:type IV pilus assembly protein PilX
MNRSARIGRKAQRGVILFVALIVLVAMTLTGIALMRSVDTNVLVAGNLAFRQGATTAGDWGVEAARTFLKTTLTANKSALDNDQPANSYYASWQANLDMIGSGVGTPFDWTAATTPVGTDSAGNEVRYVVHRMCQNAGAGTTAGANCVRTSGSSGSSPADGGTKGTVSYGGAPLPAPTVIYYRVTVRILGPRNTLSFVQAMLK